MASVQDALHDADNQPKMEAAAAKYVKATDLNVPFTPNLPDRQGLPQEVIDVAAAAQLEQPVNQRKSIGEWFGIVKDAVGNDRMPLTEAQFIARLNDDLPSAYSAPDHSSFNAMVVLLTSPPGVLGSAAPVITSGTVLSPLQTLLLVRYMATIVGNRFPCSLCDQQYFLEVAVCVIAQTLCIGATGGWLAFVCIAGGIACVGLAATHLQMCLADCHEQ